MRKAIVAGATGLVGSFLLKQLLDDSRFGIVTALVRRSAGISHPRLQEHIIDFSDPGSWSHLVMGDVVFLSLGTTRVRAGSKNAQYRVDHGYQYHIACAAARNGVGTLVLVSSAGANRKSPFFYMRMKAELERDIAALGMERTVFLRPGSLTGPRQEKRTMENLGVWVLRMLNRLGLLRKMRPIHAKIVAKAMINAGVSAGSGISTYELEAVFGLAQQSATFPPNHKQHSDAY